MADHDHHSSGSGMADLEETSLQRKSGSGMADHEHHGSGSGMADNDNHGSGSGMADHEHHGSPPIHTHNHNPKTQPPP